VLRPSARHHARCAERTGETMRHRARPGPTTTSAGTDLPSDAERFGDPLHVLVRSPAESQARRQPSDNARLPTDAHAADHDEALLLRVAGGDTGAFAALFERTEGLVYANVRRILDEPGLCDTVTQGVFQDVSGMVARFDAGCGDARDWLLTIAHRRATAQLTDESIPADPVLDHQVEPRSNPDPHPLTTSVTPSGASFQVVRSSVQTRTETS
jgi:hypothetical protein